MIILVSLKTDNAKGSAILACNAIKKDPLLTGNLILEGVRGLSWPFSGAFIKTTQWSVSEKSIHWWMVGQLVEDVSLTLDMLKNADDIPHLVGTLPVGELNQNTADILALKSELIPLPGQEQEGAEPEVPAGGEPSA